jgi:hypothetical protein
VTEVLIHIGYHKTASGWLRRVFFTNPATGFESLGKDGRKHPVRRLASTPPLEFDASSFRARFDPLLREVAGRGLCPVVAFERFSGHPFSGGYDSKEIADRLARVFPDGRILVVVREQRSIIASTYKQYVRQGGTSSLRRFLDPPTSPGIQVPQFDYRFFEYHRLLDYYRSLFGAEHVLALTYEQFREEPAAFVAEIGRFAGRPLDGPVLESLPFAEPSNPSPSAAAIEIQRRLNWIGFRSDLHPSAPFHLKALKSIARRDELAQRLERLRPRAEEAEATLRREVAELVGDRYVESNRAAAKLTGIDLAAYGWML